MQVAVLDAAYSSPEAECNPEILSVATGTPGTLTFQVTLSVTDRQHVELLDYTQHRGYTQRHNTGLCQNSRKKGLITGLRDIFHISAMIPVL